MLESISLPSFPTELCFKILSYTPEMQTLEQHRSDGGQFINEFRLLSKSVNREITRAMQNEYPEIERAIVAESLTNIALRWNTSMEKSGSKRDLFIRNIQAVTNNKRHLSLDMHDISKKSGSELLNAYNAIETILQTIIERDQNQFPIKSIEIKTPVASDFSNSEYIYNLEYICDADALFSKLIRIAKHAEGREIRFLLDLAGSGIGTHSIQNITCGLNINNLIIEKLDISNNHLCRQFRKDVSHLIKNKSIESLRLRKIKAEAIGALFCSLKEGFKNDESFNMRLLDVSGNSIGENAFFELCELIKNNIPIQSFDFRECQINGENNVHKLAQSISQNTHIREINLWGKVVDLDGLEDLFDSNHFEKIKKILKVEQKSLFLNNKNSPASKSYEYI